MFVGIDVSKLTLDICVLKNENDFMHLKIKNNITDISKFISNLDKDSLVVFESTATYSYTISNLLTQNNISYSELNPNKLSHFLRYFSDKKTDKEDSYILAFYAFMFKDTLKLTKFNYDDKLLKCNQSAINILNKISTQLKNFLDGQKSIMNPNLEKTLLNIVKNIEENKSVLEDDLFEYICLTIPNTLDILENEKGIGKSLAINLFPILDNNRDKNYKQIISFLGLSPKTFESGTSVKKRSSIDKKGSSLVRRSLYMSSLSCVRFNPKFSDFYMRLVSNGKPKKLALIAVCNKIIRHLKNKYFMDLKNE
ncbi:transposase [Campylobacter fetus]|uniref:transposase n=1 Tax=Campylobacter fetus TaxID=196 RepID=UPI00288C69FC|nr:transposase [Campylobacter fetus subsp. venerealis]